MLARRGSWAVCFGLVGILGCSSGSDSSTATILPSSAAGTGAGNRPGSAGTNAGGAGNTDAGTGNQGTGNAGTGNAGTGNAGTGNAGTGNAGTGNAGTGNAGTAGTGPGTGCSGYTTWVSGGTYTETQQLAYNGQVWECDSAPDCTATAPGTDDTVWHSVSTCTPGSAGAAAGGTGNTGNTAGTGNTPAAGGTAGVTNGPGCSAYTPWVSGGTYTETQQVAYSGVIYECDSAPECTATIPGTDAAVWTQQGICGTIVGGGGAAGAGGSTGSFRVVGYVPNWLSSLPSVQYSSLTHLNFAFAIPDSSGHLSLSAGVQLSTLVSQAHAAGVKVLISIGGASAGTGAFTAIAENSGVLGTFVSSVATMVSQYNLDGADIDWEYPPGPPSQNDFATLMAALATNLHGNGKLLTAAVADGQYNAQGVTAASFTSVDFLNLMAYDSGDSGGHSSMAVAQASLTYWAQAGLPANKTVLGVPFYGEPIGQYASQVPFSTLLGADSQAASKDMVSYSGSSYYYNGTATLASKVALAKTSASGVMIWSLDQDSGNVLLSAIHAAVGN